VLNPSKKVIPSEDKKLVDRLLLEKILLADIARAWSNGFKGISAICMRLVPMICVPTFQAKRHVCSFGRQIRYTHLSNRPSKKMLICISRQIYGRTLRHLNQI
jgi:hypothetical protein